VKIATGLEEKNYVAFYLLNDVMIGGRKIDLNINPAETILTAAQTQMEK